MNFSQNLEISTVFFDLGSVLVDVYKENIITNLAKATGLSTIDIQKADERSGEIHLKFELGLISAEEFYIETAKYLNGKINFRDFYQIFVQIFSLNKPVVEIAKKLGRKADLSIISNTNEWHYEYIMTTFQELNIFRNSTTSYQTHALKPDAKIYETACKKFDISPENSLFIDDKEENVAGAKKIGMRAVLFKTAEQLLHDLKSYGLVD